MELFVTVRHSAQLRRDVVAIGHPSIAISFFLLPPQRTPFFLSMAETICKIADSSPGTQASRKFVEAISRLATRARIGKRDRQKVAGLGVFAVVGCEISITRVPETDSIIEAGLITDSIVATSAPRNLFLFAPKRSRRIYYASRSSAHACARTPWHLSPCYSVASHRSIARTSRVIFSSPAVSRLFLASFSLRPSPARRASLFANSPPSTPSSQLTFILSRSRCAAVFPRALNDIMRQFC